jgi:cobalt-zinc-cadmium efflux system outer membrane protein
VNDARNPSRLARAGLVPPALACLLAACRIAPPRVSPEEDVASATGLANAVRFHVEGGPIDASGSEAPSLGLSDAVRMALATDPGLQAALARVRVTQAEAELAGLLPNPILDLVLRFPEGGGKASIEAGLGADLLAILQRPRRASAAGHRLRRESALALSAALDLLAEVQERYAEAQALEELVRVLERRSELFERLREVAEARLDLGEGTLHEVTTLDSERTELAVELAQRRRELRVARLALARRIGEPSSAADWVLDPWSAPAGVPAEERPWMEAALAARPEILALEWEIRAREDDEVLAGGQAFEGASVGLDAERDDDWSAGPALATPLPLFGGGGARRERARMLTSEERHRLTEAQRTVVEEARTALVGLVGAQADLERVVQDLVPLQQRRRDQIEEAYRVGHVDVTALLFADQALQGTQARRIGLERELSAALYRLQRAVGGPSAFTAVVTAARQSTP